MRHYKSISTKPASVAKPNPNVAPTASSSRHENSPGFESANLAGAPEATKRSEVLLPELAGASFFIPLLFPKARDCFTRRENAVGPRACKKCARGHSQNFHDLRRLPHRWVYLHLVLRLGLASADRSGICDLNLGSPAIRRAVATYALTAGDQKASS